MSTMADAIVDAMGAIHGVHPGKRAVHAKGHCATGSFTATSAAAGLCTALHLQGDEVPVTVRFSGGSGKPARADGARDERGMAVKFHLPDDATTDMVALTLPVFFVKTPETFLEFLETQRPDPATGKPDLDKIGEFINSHPETQVATMFVMAKEAPASYAVCTFNGIHAFFVTGSDGTRRPIRYQWRPAVPEETLSDAETRALGKEYLGEELERRLGEGPIVFTLHFQLGTEDDDTTDPTTAWPEEREWVHVGTMTLTEYGGQSCDGMIFDPGRLTDGIERSDDPILHARSEAYSVSYARRTAST